MDRLRSLRPEDSGPLSSSPPGGIRGLIGDLDLELSPVVANNAMNRARGLGGVNGYGRELGFDVLDLLRRRLAARGRVAWLDLCCGEGRAVIEGAAMLAAAAPVSTSTSTPTPTSAFASVSDADSGAAGPDDAVTIVGVDLVDAFALGGRSTPPGLELVTASVTRWAPAAGQVFDLVTCVHGLHYIGDKLGLLARAAAWTAPDGVFAASFDPAEVRHSAEGRALDGDGAPAASGGGRSAARRVLSTLREAGAVYDPRRHVLTWRGPIAPDFAAGYAGADAAAGPGYTGMDSVNSHYRWDGRRRNS